MNTPGHDHVAREWEAQEHARRQARTAAVTNPPAARGSGPSRDLSPAVERSPASPHEAGDAAYRHVAEALRRPPPVDLPPDFAARVARIADVRAATSVAGSPRLEPLPQSGAFERVLTGVRSEEHTSELQSLMRISYAVFCLKKNKKHTYITNTYSNIEQQ